MKVLITEKTAKEGIERLSNVNIEPVEISKKLSPEELIKEIPKYRVAWIRSKTKITKDVIDAGVQGDLQLIARAGKGCDNVDIEYATDKGVLVENAPEGGTRSVSEFTSGLMLDISRNILQAHYSLKQGTWKKKQFQGTELNGKTALIIGCGRIGIVTAEILSRGYNMNVKGYDPYAEKDKVLPIKLANSPREKIPEELLRNSDYIILHLPKQKKPVIDAESFKLIKNSAYLINVSRGENVDEESLYYALQRKDIAGAALDVLSKEGKEDEPFENKLLNLENLVVTPHLGASTDEGQKRTAIEMADSIIAYLHEGRLINCLNASEGAVSEEKKTYNAFVTHKNVSGMFGKISDVFGKHNINIVNEKPANMFYDWKNPAPNTTTCFRAQQDFGKDVIEEIKKINNVYRVIK